MYVFCFCFSSHKDTDAFQPDVVWFMWLVFLRDQVSKSTTTFTERDLMEQTDGNIVQCALWCLLWAKWNDFHHTEKNWTTVLLLAACGQQCLDCTVMEQKADFLDKRTQMLFQNRYYISLWFHLCNTSKKKKGALYYLPSVTFTRSLDDHFRACMWQRKYANNTSPSCLYLHHFKIYLYVRLWMFEYCDITCL